MPKPSLWSDMHPTLEICLEHSEVVPVGSLTVGERFVIGTNLDDRKWVYHRVEPRQFEGRADLIRWGEDSVGFGWFGSPDPSTEVRKVW